MTWHLNSLNLQPKLALTMDDTFEQWIDPFAKWVLSRVTEECQEEVQRGCQERKKSHCALFYERTWSDLANHALEGSFLIPQKNGKHCNYRLCNCSVWSFQSPEGIAAKLYQLQLIELAWSTKFLLSVNRSPLRPSISCKKHCNTNLRIRCWSRHTWLQSKCWSSKMVDISIQGHEYSVSSKRNSIKAIF